MCLSLGFLMNKKRDNTGGGGNPANYGAPRPAGPPPGAQSAPAPPYQGR